MKAHAERLRGYEDIVARLSGALRAARLYSSTHPSVAEHVRALHAAIEEIHRAEPAVLIGFVGGEIIADDTPLLSASGHRADLIRHMEALGIHRVVFERGVTQSELTKLVQAASNPDLAARRAAASDQPEAEFLALAHLRAGHIPIDASAGRWGSSAITMRRTYATSVESMRTVWDSARLDGQPELPTARDTVEHLAESVGQSRGLMIGLTGMKLHDEYTFTHMVNVSILAMAQARALGVEGRQLRELGLAALLHDIGKVRTPIEILNKPAALTPREFEIMKRHPIDGAAILRGLTDAPRLASIVAFEHHLRLDGTGYPAGLARPTLNVATQLAGIADVYDAMRSQRRYQQAFPSDRIIEVMRRNDGRQFDQHLVRGFIDLMGVYPPGTCVRLSSGDVAIVVENDGPEPDRPTVKMIADSRGNRLASPLTRSLWHEAADEHGDFPTSITAALDPEPFQIDPVALLAPA